MLRVKTLNHPMVCKRFVVLEEVPMLDIAMLACGGGFFALLIGYTFLCDKL